MQAPYVARVHQFDSTRCALLTLRACLIITHQYNRWNVGIQTLPKLCSPTRSPQKKSKKEDTWLLLLYLTQFSGKIRVQVSVRPCDESWTISEFWGAKDMRVGGRRAGSWIWNKRGRWMLAVTTASLTVATARADEDIFRFSVCHCLSMQCWFFP